MKLKIFNQKKIIHKNGQIVVFQKSKKINFNIKRVFVVNSNKNQIRGKHAHKKCLQLLNCVNGSVEINYETKSGYKSKLILSKSNQYIIIPNYTWSVQKYLKNNSILLVICDQKYNEADYIRDYKSFIKLTR